MTYFGIQVKYRYIVAGLILEQVVNGTLPTWTVSKLCQVTLFLSDSIPLS